MMGKQNLIKLIKDRKTFMMQSRGNWLTAVDMASIDIYDAALPALEAEPVITTATST